ncbi:isochorismatase family protein [Rothia sp. AR01]|uniref:Isochorismatase family protein n=1 Tax=Rothia santali TaxID=2949643 RepID=A0A9X2HHJ4_9MICC|nr:isochorismatase family protein [Rothia santali]MCP3424998.1 isochorismatase family protein [Rothia santali]
MSLPAITPYRLDSGERWNNRTSWTLDPDRAMLLIHDMQNHFIDAFDRRPESQIELAIEEIASLRVHCAEAGVPSIYTAQPPSQDPADRQLLTEFWGPGLDDERAASIIDRLTPTERDTILTKWRYSAFFRSDLEHRMRNHGRDQLIITGVYSHIGCLTTALAAFMLGFQVFFVSDAQADFTEADHRMALEYVAKRCGQTCLSEDVKAALSRGASVGASAGGVLTA